MLLLSGSLAAIGAWSMLPGGWGDLPANRGTGAILLTALTGLIAGGGMWTLTRATHRHLSRREAMLLVSLTWVVGAAIGALPFHLWAMMSDAAPPDHVFRSYVASYFEAMSGFTTTGATVVGDVESLPRSLLLWRSVTHWLGGLGIVVLFVAILPMLGAGGKKLVAAETSGITSEGLRPHIRETARVLWLIYLGLTIAQVLLLRLIGGMNLFDAVNHAFATLATGGFSTRNASITPYLGNSLAPIIIIVFMILAGLNFGLYYQAIRGRWKSVWEDRELRLYVAIIFAAGVIVSWSLYARGDPLVMTDGTSRAATLGSSALHGVFTTASLQTTTGFGTADYNHWPPLAKCVLVAIMFVGGCAGSTSSGFKVIRLWVISKVMVAELEREFRPNVVRAVRIGRATIDMSVRLGTVAFVLGFILIWAAGGAMILLLEEPRSDCDLQTAMTASLATLSNVGPGFGLVGAPYNYGWFSDWSLAIMSLLMALGRLELFAILVVLTPRFWRGD
jgi:trk system potassium uptake protein TrkH